MNGRVPRPFSRSKLIREVKGFTRDAVFNTTTGIKKTRMYLINCLVREDGLYASLQGTREKAKNVTLGEKKFYLDNFNK